MKAARRRGDRKTTLLSVLLGMPLLVTTSLALRPDTARAAECGPLATLALHGATVDKAETVTAGSYVLPTSSLNRIMTQPGMSPTGRIAPPANSAFCRIAATLRPSSDSRIRIEVWMPLAGWNGKLLGVGNFGWVGSLMPAGMLSGIAAGYAAASTDTGHDSSTAEGQGGGFTLGHPES